MVRANEFDPAQPAPFGTQLSVPACPGLRLRIGKTGRTWVYRHRPPRSAKLKEFTLGHFGTGHGEMSLLQAMAAWEQAKSAIKAGIDPFAEAKQEKAERKSQREEFSRPGMTLWKMAEDFLTEHADNLVNGWESRRMLTKEIEGKSIANKPVERLTIAELAQFLQAIIDRGAPSLARMTRQALAQAWEHGVGRGRIDEALANPFKRVMRGAPAIKAHKKSRYLNDLEIRALLNWLPGSDLSHRIQAVLEVMLRTGMRGGEVVAMEWRHVDLNKGIYHLPEGGSKTGVGRPVQLATQVVSILQGLKVEGDTFVFEVRKRLDDAKGVAMSQNAIGVARSACTTPSPIDAWTPHDLRRTVRTGLSRMRVPGDVAEAVLGHTKGGVEGVYNLHMYEQEQREALQAWNDHIDHLRDSKSDE